MPFNVPLISEIDHNLWQGGCEQGLILPRLVKHLVSLYSWERFTVRRELNSVLVARMYDSENQARDERRGRCWSTARQG